MEVGEAPQHADYERFKAAVLEKTKTNVAELDRGTVKFEGTSGDSLRLRFDMDVNRTEIDCNGRRRDLREQAKHAFRCSDPNEVLILQEWLGGKLTVQTDSARFVGEVSEAGSASFRNEAVSK